MAILSPPSATTFEMLIEYDIVHECSKHPHHYISSMLWRKRPKKAVKL